MACAFIFGFSLSRPAPPALLTPVTISRTRSTAARPWHGTSHITGDDGAVYDSTFTFAAVAAPTGQRFTIQSGQVTITKQPTSTGQCTTTIDASHPIGAMDGHLTVDDADPDNPTVSGGGDTVWIATYTTVCPTGTSTMMLPYSAAWWPAQPGVMAPVVAPHGQVTIPVSGVGGSGTVMLQES